jgi:hypothetical protein
MVGSDRLVDINIVCELELELVHNPSRVSYWVPGLILRSEREMKERGQTSGLMQILQISFQKKKKKDIADELKPTNPYDNSYGRE